MQYLSVSACALLGAGLVGCGSGGSTERATGGPISVDSEQGASIVLRSGQMWTDAMVALRNGADSDATLERVELVGASPGLRLLEAYATLREGPSTLGDTRFPPPPITRANIRPLEGTTVAPHRGGANHADVQLLLRIQPPKTRGRYVFDRIRLSYRVGDTSYVQSLEHARAFCVTKTAAAECATYEPDSS